MCKVFFSFQTSKSHLDYLHQWAIKLNVSSPKTALYTQTMGSITQSMNKYINVNLPLIHFVQTKGIKLYMSVSIQVIHSLFPLQI